MDIATLEQKAKQAGFDQTAQIKTELIVFDAEFRKACQSNVCRKFGKSHTCPPLVGEAEQCILIAQSFLNAVLMQSIVQLEDSFDFEGMTEGKNLHEKRIRAFKALVHHENDILILGAGSCSFCSTCFAEANLPCPFPNEALSSMEAYCMDVCKTVTNAGLKYNNGSATVSYVGIALTGKKL